MIIKTILAALLLCTSSLSLASIDGLQTKADNSKVDVSKALHKIELGFFSTSVTVKLVNLMYQIGNLMPVSSKNGSTYFTASFLNEQEAAKNSPDNVSMGFNQAIQVVQYKKDIFSLREFNFMIEGGEIKDDISVPVLRIWK